MTRPLRVDIEDGWYHVTSRGLERRSIFLDDRSREHFLELLCEAVERYRIRIHAYVLMSNHYHLILQTPDANLSTAMQWINISYAAWFNNRRNRAGPLFQGRFKSIPIENSSWAYRLSLYVHLNPIVRSAFGLGKGSRRVESKGWKQPTPEQARERLAKLRAYRWCSYRAYAGYTKSPMWLETSDILDRAGPKGSNLQLKYREAVKSCLSQGADPGLVDKLKDRLALGSEAFASKIRNLGKTGREISEKRVIRNRATFEDVTHEVERLRGEPYATFMSRRGDWGRPLLLWGAKAYTGLTYHEIGAQIGGADYSAVHMMIKRFTEKAKGDRFLARQIRSLRETLCNVET